MCHQDQVLYPFPQSGWHPAYVYCLSLRMDMRTFMDNLKKLRVPRRRLGVVTLIRAEDLIEASPQVDTGRGAALAITKPSGSPGHRIPGCRRPGPAPTHSAP